MHRYLLHYLISAGLLDKPVTLIVKKSQNFVESEVNYHIHKNLLPIAILCHMNAVHSPHIPFLLSDIFIFFSPLSLCL